MTPEEERPVWPIRFTDEAAADVLKVCQYLTETAGEAAADRWEDGLLERLRMLSLTPLAGAVAAEADLFTPPLPRHIVYRQSRRGTAFRVLYQVHEDTPDGPQVMVISVRHGARGPMTAEDAKERDAGAET